MEELISPPRARRTGRHLRQQPFERFDVNLFNPVAELCSTALVRFSPFFALRDERQQHSLLDCGLMSSRLAGVATGARYILVINSGSSSLKFSLLDIQSEAVIANWIAERLGTVEATLKFSAKSTEDIRAQIPYADHGAALRRVVSHFPTLAAKANEVDAIGHRIVHGGECFRDAVIIDNEVLKRIEKLTDLAYLHNPPGAQGNRVVSELFPNRPQVAVFDITFHQTLPPHAFHYAIPAEFFTGGIGENSSGDRPV